MSWGPGLEGETPLENRDGLRDSSIFTREQLNKAEAQNVARVVEKYLIKKPRKRSATFEYVWLLTLHKEMFGRVWSWAGQVRTEDLNIGSPFGLIAEHLAQMTDDIAFREPLWNMLEQAVHIHHRSVQIHPFRNGNGRWSRMLANIWLRLHAHPLIEWPAEIGAETSAIRQEYLRCIPLADLRDMESLIALHRRYCNLPGAP